MNCANCRWWEGKSSPAIPDCDIEARCCLYGNYELTTIEHLRVRVPGDESNYLMTKGNFGCVQFEKKK